MDEISPPKKATRSTLRPLSPAPEGWQSLVGTVDQETADQRTRARRKKRNEISDQEKQELERLERERVQKEDRNYEEYWSRLMQRHETLKREHQRVHEGLSDPDWQEAPSNRPQISFPPPNLFPTQGRTWAEYDAEQEEIRRAAKNPDGRETRKADDEGQDHGETRKADEDPDQVETRNVAAILLNLKLTASAGKHNQLFGSTKSTSPSSSNRQSNVSSTAAPDTLRRVSKPPPELCSSMVSERAEWNASESNVIAILATSFATTNPYERQQRTTNVQSSLARSKSNRPIPSFCEQLEILNSIVANEYTDPELNELFFSNFLLGKTISFYSEWITKALEGRLCSRDKAGGLPSTEMVKSDQNIIRWIFYVLHRATNGKTYWDHSGTLKTTSQRRRSSIDSNATNPSEEIGELEETDVRWAKGQSWYEYLRTNNLLGQQTRGETTRQVIFWRSLVEKYLHVGEHEGIEDDERYKEKDGEVEIMARDVEDTESEDDLALIIRPSNYHQKYHRIGRLSREERHLTLDKVRRSQYRLQNGNGKRLTDTRV